MTGAQRAANGEAPAPTEVGLLAGGKTARRAGLETSGDDGLSALRYYSHIHANSELANMYSHDGAGMECLRGGGMAKLGDFQVAHAISGRLNV